MLVVYGRNSGIVNNVFNTCERNAERRIYGTCTWLEIGITQWRRSLEVQSHISCASCSSRTSPWTQRIRKYSRLFSVCSESCFQKTYLQLLTTAKPLYPWVCVHPASKLAYETLETSTIVPCQVQKHASEPKKTVERGKQEYDTSTFGFSDGRTVRKWNARQVALLASRRN